MNVNFSFTNTTDESFTVTPVAIKPASSYAVTSDEPTELTGSNLTAPVDQPEILTYRCQELKTVNTAMENMYPPEVRTGVQYVIKLDELASVTDTADPTFRVDLPISAYLTIRHNKSGYITSDMIATVVKRLLGACMKEDGAWRFDELMRSSLKPTVDQSQCDF